MAGPLKIQATNTFAIPTLNYYMCNAEWTMHDLQELEREIRKMLTVVGGGHPGASVLLLYLPWSMGGRGMKSVEQEYVETKIKMAVDLYSSNDPTMKAVAQIDQQRKEKGWRSIMGVDINNNKENCEWKKNIRKTTKQKLQRLRKKSERSDTKSSTEYNKKRNREPEMVGSSRIVGKMTPWICNPAFCGLTNGKSAWWML